MNGASQIRPIVAMTLTNKAPNEQHRHRNTEAPGKRVNRKGDSREGGKDNLCRYPKDRTDEEEERGKVNGAVSGEDGSNEFIINLPA
jgi:hypothetical protein